MKKIIITFTLIALAFGLYYYFSKSSNPQAFQMPAADVEVLKADKQTIYDKVQVLGSSYANESVEITPTVSETIHKINFSDGERVEKGDLIAILAQDEETAQLKAAELQLKEHNRELSRLKTLIAKKATSQRTLDERKTMRDITAQQIQEIKARIKDRTIKAPFDGVLGIRSVSVGSLVQPGDIITTIEDISKIKLDFNIPSNYLSQLKSGIPIQATSDALDGEIFKGQIETINNRVDPVTRSILVRAIIENPEEKIRPGILMKVTLLKNERTAIVVPEESIIQQGTDHFLMIVDSENKVEKRKVETGIHKEGVIEIISGLEMGEQIIVRGVHKVQNGSAVKIAKIWDSVRKPITGTLGDN